MCTDKLYFEHKCSSYFQFVLDKAFLQTVPEEYTYTVLLDASVCSIDSYFKKNEVMQPNGTMIIKGIRRSGTHTQLIFSYSVALGFNYVPLELGKIIRILPSFLFPLKIHTEISSYIISVA